VNIETVAVHAGREVDPTTGALTPPINLSTTFERDADGSYSRDYVYSRRGNPNRTSLEKAVAELEGGEDACAFSSGSAAAMSILQSFRPNDHILLPDDAYHGTGALVRDLFSRWSLASTVVDMSDINAVEKSFLPTTRLVWIETPSNPLLKISDISRLSVIAHRHRAIVVCDNTWATPVLQSPLLHGADLVLHATTKYLCGHGDVLGGIVVTKSTNEFFASIRNIQQIGGAVPSPFDCWLLLRSLPTLPYRMRAHSNNALKIASFLEQNERVAAVHYPGMETHSNHSVAVHQMRQFGGMISIQLKRGIEEAMAVCANVRIFKRATSLG